jgi:hypothetical protein
MEDKKRTTHTYKVPENIYRRAMARAKKEKTTLARIVEIAVIDYAYPNKTDKK